MMGELTRHSPVKTIKIFGEDLMERPGSGPRSCKWILEIIGDLEMLVHVNITQFSFGG